MEVEILIEGNDVSILSLQDATGWTKESLPLKPQLTGSTWRRIEHDQSELLIALHDQKGKVFRTYAYPGRYVSFLETVLRSEKADESSLTGGFASPLSNVRMLVLPLPDRTAFISFYRSEIRHEPLTLEPEALNQERFHVSTFETRPEGDRNRTRGEVVSFGWNMLGMCPAPRPPGNPPPKPFELLEIPDILKFPRFPEDDLSPTLLMKRRPDWSQMSFAKKECFTGSGTVTGHVQLHTAMVSRPKRAFNIVIFGDGFTASTADVNRYQKFAKLAADTFQATAPYSTHFQYINLWRIDTTCLTSGIANCPEKPCPDPPEPTQTYYRISGCAPCTAGIPECNPPYPGYMAPKSLCPLNIAAQKELPGTYVDLRLVIANCNIYGGAAYPADRLVVIPADEDLDEFSGLVLHESAHVIGRVCDEYWVCVKWEGETFPNFATLAQVNAGTVPWRLLDSSWALKKHVHGIPPCSASDHNADPCLGTGTTTSASLHGAFWGCQFIASSSVVKSICCNWDCTDMHTNSLASPYFRPSPRCKMKELSRPFCYVCSQAVGEKLKNPPAVLLP